MHSKWLEVVVVPSTTSAATTKALRSIFATHGLPEILVSDNCHGLNWSYLFVYVVGLLAPFVVDLYLALGWFH